MRVPEAFALAPEGWDDTPEEMLPTTPWRGRCRICGEVAHLDTREHIPPRVAGNSGQYRGFSFQDWLDKTDPDDLNPSGGKPGQGGTWGFTLCGKCNNVSASAVETMVESPPARSFVRS